MSARAARPRLHPPQSECCQEAGGTACLAGWAGLAARHGLMSLDVFECGGGGAGARAAAAGGGSSGAGAATPRAAASRRQLRKMLSMVAEGAGEGEGEGQDESEGAERAAATAAAEPCAEGASAEGAEQPAATGAAPRRPAELLAAAAAAGLVPRPGSGCHLTTAGGDGCASLLHLDPLPFRIRHGGRGRGRAAGGWAGQAMHVTAALDRFVHNHLPSLHPHTLPPQAARPTRRTSTGCSRTA